MKYRIGIIGAGAWGTTLAKVLAEKGNQVHLWAHDPGLAAKMARDQQNSLYLPGVRLPKEVAPTASLKEAASGKEVIVLVTPSHALRDVVKETGSFFGSQTRVVIATKGLERDSAKRMSQVVRETLPAEANQRIAVLSGPSFAREVAEGAPAAVTVASENDAVAKEMQALLSTSYFRVYTSGDVVGVELGGALKNVIAIGVGVCVGLNLGFNSQAALITRGIAEMTRLAVKLGANPLTLAGLSGLGDLVLTATGHLSRNRALGIKLGQGQKLEQILKETITVAEGVNTARAVYDLSKRLNVEMPISEQVYLILYEGLSPKEAVAALMSRGLKEEIQF